MVFAIVNYVKILKVGGHKDFMFNFCYQVLINVNWLHIIICVMCKTFGFQKDLMKFQRDLGIL
jgi:hypothetical protein